MLMFDCRFRPAPPGVFGDKPLSPMRGKTAAEAAAEGGGDAKPAAAASPAPVGVYRPKGASGAVANLLQGGERAQAGKLQPSGQAAAYKPPSARGGQEAYIPGLAQMQLKPPKGAKKPSSASASGGGGVQPKEKEKGVKAAAPAPAKSGADDADGGAGAADDTPEKALEKQMKRCRKVLKDIAEIEAKGGPVNADQETKMGRKAEMEQKLAELAAEMERLKAA